jgi:hypothetical protein
MSVGYYASVFDRSSNAGHGRVALAAGPFPTHEDALAHVSRVRTLAEHFYPYRAHFWAFGTCSSEPATGVGRWNHLLYSPLPLRGDGGEPDYERAVEAPKKRRARALSRP